MCTCRMLYADRYPRVKVRHERMRTCHISAVVLRREKSDRWAPLATQLRWVRKGDDLGRHLELLSSPPRLRDATGTLLPARPQEGMLFEVRCRCGNRCHTWRVRRVNNRSFYISSWGQPLQRLPLESWTPWLEALLREGDIRLTDRLGRPCGREHPEPPPLELLEGGRS